MSIWDFFVWFFWFYIAITCIWIFITVFIDISVTGRSMAGRRPSG